MIDDIKS